MKNLLIAIMFSLLFTIPASAAELLMIHNPACVFCQAFMRDVAPGYNETKQGKALFLTVIDLSVFENRKWLGQELKAGNIKRIHGTPTFIIYDDGKEIGRVEGYGGKEWFYQKLDEAVKESVQGK